MMAYTKLAVTVASYVKVGKTVLAPTTTVRNLISGFALSAANGHIPFGKETMLP